MFPFSCKTDEQKKEGGEGCGQGHSGRRWGQRGSSSWREILGEQSDVFAAVGCWPWRNPKLLAGFLALNEAVICLGTFFQKKERPKNFERVFFYKKKVHYFLSSFSAISWKRRVCNHCLCQGLASAHELTKIRTSPNPSDRSFFISKLLNQ